ncbi:MAG: L-seryl-tRNA(Sec) selenium transferase, partial [Candidatus Zixiibacteriota bacterium]
ELTGAPAALVVNNCAGALFLALNTLSNRRETLISRGELVQIGGGFRVPDIMRRAGVKLTEVGTTNITRLADYAGAVTEKTSLLLKVSLSNFSQRGFVDHTPISELCSLARRHNLAVVYDLGSGLAADPLRVGLQGQESLTSALAAGADIVCASGDKLLGGPQAGLVLGDTQAIAKLRKNPLYRTLRPDKITLALLGRILEQYLDGAWEEGIPLWRLAQRTESDLYELGRRIITAVGAEDRLTLEAVSARYGGGSLPDVELPSCAISFSGTHAPDTLARIFRELPRPVVGRIENERFLLDLRALLAEDEAALVVGLKSALKILSASQ